jgi:hypothetical protein
MQGLLDTLVMDQGYVTLVRKRVQFSIHRLHQATLRRHTYEWTEGLYTQGEGSKHRDEGKVSRTQYMRFPFL